ncbi:hypothetical protein [Burkholderia gladioli]|uniref:hypothetical protein n=1 Tax=Burkholderia gladioli TaxID=28095 RepID=UPI0016420B5E|nr:hypothetical protein [Burkholderia gladioli]
MVAPASIRCGGGRARETRLAAASGPGRWRLRSGPAGSPLSTGTAIDQPPNSTVPAAIAVNRSSFRSFACMRHASRIVVPFFKQAPFRSTPDQPMRARAPALPRLCDFDNRLQKAQGPMRAARPGRVAARARRLHATGRDALAS